MIYQLFQMHKVCWAKQKYFAWFGTKLERPTSLGACRKYGVGGVKLRNLIIAFDMSGVPTFPHIPYDMASFSKTIHK